jgi:hypothetical protein
MLVKIFLVIVALSLVSCSSTTVYVKHCKELDDGVFKCEKID